MWRPPAAILLVSVAAFCVAARAAEPAEPAGVPEPPAASSTEEPAAAPDPAAAAAASVAVEAGGATVAAEAGGRSFADLPPALPPKLAAPPPHSFVVPAVEAAALQLVVMGWNVWPGEATWSNVSLESIERNAQSRWVIDDDEFYTNQLLHPYQGSFSFAAARSAGLGFWESVPYAFLSSLAWEIAGETEQPSVNDQITTTIGGVVVGELLHRFSEGLRAGGESAWRAVPAALLSPFSALNRALLGRPPAPPREPRQWELSLGAEAARVPGPEAGASPGWSSHGRLGVTLVHGVPWHPELALEGPFDHYRLEAGYARSEDRRVTLLVRGLLAGRVDEARAWRGVSGLFALLDLDTPGDLRVATVGLGLGTSGGAPLGRGLAVEATVIAAAVPMAAIGTRPPVVEDGRDYRLGPGAQGLAEVALTGWERAALRLGARGYAVVGVDGVSGTEAVGLVRAQALVRLAGDHGLGVEASLGGRRVDEVGLPVRTELGRTFQIFYALTALEAPRALDGRGELASR